VSKEKVVGSGGFSLQIFFLEAQALLKNKINTEMAKNAHFLPVCFRV
jgi:hypothetical protein